MLITVRVIPRSSRNALAWEQGTLKARLTAPPVDGAAALINLLAQRLSIPRRSISIVRGETARQKTLAIADLTLDEVERRLSTDDA